MQEAKPPMRRRWWWLGGIIAGALIAVLTQLRAQPAPGEEGAVLSADNALAAALRNGDRSAARKLLSLEFTSVDEDGAVHMRKKFLGDLKGAAAGPATETKVKIYGLVAMATGHHRTARGNDTFFIDIWVKQKRAWRALAMQDVMLGTTAAAGGARDGDAKPYDCKNPCQTIPYRVRSPAEQDVVNAFQAIERAVAAHDAAEWQKHIAGEFELYRTGYAPVGKAARIAAIEQQKQNGAAVALDEVQAMRLAVYGDGAAMTATHTVPDNSRPPYRAARVWVRRNGQWQMAISVQTEIKNPDAGGH